MCDWQPGTFQTHAWTERPMADDRKPDIYFRKVTLYTPHRELAAAAVLSSLSGRGGGVGVGRDHILSLLKPVALNLVLMQRNQCSDFSTHGCHRGLYRRTRISHRHPTNIGIISKAILAKLPKDFVERLWAFPSAKIPP